MRNNLDYLATKMRMVCNSGFERPIQNSWGKKKIAIRLNGQSENRPNHMCPLQAHGAIMGCLSGTKDKIFSRFTCCTI